MSSNVPSVVLRQASPSSHRAPDWSMPEKRDSAQSIRDYSYIAWEAFYRADLCHNHSPVGVGVQVRARWDPYWRTVIHVRCYNVRWFLYDECSLCWPHTAVISGPGLQRYCACCTCQLLVLCLRKPGLHFYPHVAAFCNTLPIEPHWGKLRVSPISGNVK